MCGICMSLGWAGPGKEGAGDVVTLLSRGGFAAGKSKPKPVFKVITHGPGKRGGAVLQDLYAYVAEAGTMRPCH